MKSQSPLESDCSTDHDQVWTEFPGSDVLTAGGGHEGPLRAHVGSGSFYEVQSPAEVHAFAPLLSLLTVWPQVLQQLPPYALDK